MALDLAGTVGWAYGPVSAPAPVFGCWKLPKIGGEGARYAGFENVLIEAMTRMQPGRMVLEAPLPLMAQSQAKVAQQQYTLRGLAYAEAYRAGIAISEVSADLVRHDLLGRSRFNGEAKKEVLHYCRQRGWVVPDHNAADACMVWAWYKGQVTRNGAPAPPGLLFARGG